MILFYLFWLIRHFLLFWILQVILIGFSGRHVVDRPHTGVAVEAAIRSSPMEGVVMMMNVSVMLENLDRWRSVCQSVFCICVDYFILFYCQWMWKFVTFFTYVYVFYGFYFDRSLVGYYYFRRMMLKCSFSDFWFNLALNWFWSDLFWFYVIFRIWLVFFCIVVRSIESKTLLIYNRTNKNVLIEKVIWIFIIRFKSKYFETKQKLSI